MLPNSIFKDKDPSLSMDFFAIGPKNLAVGISDGVGHWKNLGLNPRKFAEQLVTWTVECLEFTLENIKNAIDVD